MTIHILQKKNQKNEIFATRLLLMNLKFIYTAQWLHIPVFLAADNVSLLLVSGISLLSIAVVVAIDVVADEVAMVVAVVVGFEVVVVVVVLLVVIGFMGLYVDWNYFIQLTVLTIE